MGIRIEGNLFYIQSKEMSMIIENKEGDLLLRHIGGKIAKYYGSNAILEKDHAFSGNPTPDNRTFSYDTQRQVFGVHGFGDFRQPSLKIAHANNELTQFKLTSSEILHGAKEATGLPNPHSTEDAETLVLTLEDNFTTLLMLIAALFQLMLRFEIYQIKQLLSIVLCQPCLMCQLLLMMW